MKQHSFALLNQASKYAERLHNGKAGLNSLSLELLYFYRWSSPGEQLLFSNVTIDLLNLQN